ncbi:hypothetical protein HYX58_03145 [Candidatus Dependentiae bacterium]|nr:hypothetical protein [Candidatus Dependentiae bacterium]
MNLMHALLGWVVISFQLSGMEQAKQKKRVSWAKVAEVRSNPRYLRTQAEEFRLSTPDEQFSTVLNLSTGVLFKKKRETGELLKLFGFDPTHKVCDMEASGKKIMFNIKKDGTIVHKVCLKRCQDEELAEPDEKKRKKNQELED